MQEICVPAVFKKAGDNERLVLWAAAGDTMFRMEAIL